MTMKIQRTICLQVLLLLWSEQVLQDVAGDLNPTSEMTSSAISDANLMFEFLLGGIEINEDNNIILLDKEMESMRQGRTFLSQINDNIPKNLKSMKQMMATLKRQRRPLTHTQFEGLVLSMVYSAQEAWQQERKEDKEVWGAVLLQLVNTTVYDLRGNYLFAYA